MNLSTFYNTVYKKLIIYQSVSVSPLSPPQTPPRAQRARDRATAMKWKEKTAKRRTEEVAAAAAAPHPAGRGASAWSTG